MSKEKIKLNSEKINKRESRIKVLKLGLLISTVFLIVIFLSKLRMKKIFVIFAQEKEEAPYIVKLKDLAVIRLL